MRLIFIYRSGATGHRRHVGIATASKFNVPATAFQLVKSPGLIYPSPWRGFSGRQESRNVGTAPANSAAGQSPNVRKHGLSANDALKNSHCAYTLLWTKTMGKRIRAHYLLLSPTRTKPPTAKIQWKQTLQALRSTNGINGN